MIKNLLKAHLHLGDNSIRFNRVRGKKSVLQINTPIIECKTNVLI